MEKHRIETATKIIQHAIKKGLALRKASVECGYASTYVKNIKRELYFEEKNGIGNYPEIQPLKFALANYAELKKDDGRIVKVTPDTENFKEQVNELIQLGEDIKKLNAKPADLPITQGEQTRFTQEGNNATLEWIDGSNYPKNHIKTLDELLTRTEVDLDIWKVKNYVVNKWDVTAIIDSVPRTFENFQVKAWLEKNLQNAKEKAIGELFLDMIKNYQPPVLTLNPVRTQAFKHPENNLLEICVFDLHLGKLAWGGETGENYDTKIARARFLDAIESLLNHATGFQYSKILFPIGNDFFNSDTIFNTTTKGTPQDEDLRWQKTFNVGIRLLVDGINLLKQMGVPVDVMVIPGNHDFERSFYMGSVLEAWFNNDLQVSVNNGASPRKYYVFGQVLLGFTHGSEEKENSLPMLMTMDKESKPYWSTTTYHEYHLGHQHRKKNLKFTVIDKTKMLEEEHGVIIRYLSSLTGTEEWHHKKGFVGQIKAADAFVWNDEVGLLAHLNSNLRKEVESA